MARAQCLKLFIAASLVLSGSSHANILYNGSFEEPVLPSGTYMEIIRGGSVGGGPGIDTWVFDGDNAGPFQLPRTYLIDEACGAGCTNAVPIVAATPSGKQFYLEGHSQDEYRTTQTFHVPVAAHYALSFLQADAVSGSGGFLQVDFTTLVQRGSFLPGGRHSFTTAAGSGWILQTLELDIPAGAFHLEFWSVPGRLAIFDDVQLDVFEPAAVPEPQTYAMLVAGLGLLAFMGRRTRRNAD